MRAAPCLVVAGEDDLPALLAKTGLASAGQGVRRIELPYLYGGGRPLRTRYAWVLVAGNSGDVGARGD